MTGHGTITENEARTRGITADRIEGNVRFSDRYHVKWTPRADMPPKQPQPPGWCCGVPPGGWR